MRTKILFSLPLAAVSLLPAVSFSQSVSSAVVVDAEASHSSSSESAESPEPPATPAARANKNQRPSGIGVGIRLSLLGVGGEVAVPLTRRSNLRGGFNAFGYSRGFDKDGISYAAHLSFRSVEAHYDWYPFAGRFHLSPGLMVYNGNKLTGAASVPGRQAFTLGGTQYLSGSADPITGNAKLEFNKVAPTFLLGFGNLVPRNKRHFSVNFEVGVAFQGSPQVTLNLRGTACDPTGLICRNAATDPTVLGNVASEQRKINRDLSPFKVYPLISLGFSYRF